MKPIGYYHPFRSVYDNSQCVVIFTGFARDSRNVKTGPMIQSHIMRARIDPLKTRKTETKSVCGDCPMWSKCYVRWERSPLSVYKTHRRRRYSRLTDLTVFNGHHVRFGSDGDPASVPGPLWQGIARESDGWTGYTHGWHRDDAQHLKGLLMASCDSVGERAMARSMGWSTFRAREEHAPIMPGEIDCPAAAGKTTCVQCGACDGRHGDRTIVYHGSKVKGKR